MPDYAYRSLQKRHIQFPLRIFLLISALAFSIPVIVLFNKSQVVISPLPEEETRQSSIIRIPVQSAPKKKDPTELRASIDFIMKNASNNYSVLVKDFNSDFEVAEDDSIIYVAASINKVPILAALYDKIQKQEVDPDKVITMQASDVQDYGTGSMRYDPPGTTYSIKTLAKLMMKQSDNTAAYIIANHIIGLKTLQQYVESWGLTQTDMIENKTSNRDMAILFQKIFSGGIANQALTQEMQSLLTDSDFESRLPALLPDNATIYHKIGTEVGIIHDVGVVDKQGKKYYIGVMIGDVTDEKHAEDLIAKTSKAVYDFMQ